MPTTASPSSPRPAAFLRAVAALSCLALVASLPTSAFAEGQIGRLSAKRGAASAPSPGRPAGDQGGIAGACGEVSFSQSVSSTIAPLTTAECIDDSGGLLVSAENGLARRFTAPSALHIRCVDFAIQTNAGPSWPVEARVWVNGAVLTASEPIQVPANSGPALYTATFPDFAAIPAGTDFFVELHVASRLPQEGGDGGVLFFGSNSLGQSAPSYIRAPFCGVDEFTDLAQFGFGSAHLVMTVHADLPTQSLQAFGFDQTASGDIVERKDANGKVTIWHAAAPASGSVSIELGILPGPMGVALDGSFATGSPDSTITWSPIVGFDGLPEGPVGVTTFHTDDGTHGTIQVDYSMLGTAAQTVRLFDQDGAPIADFAWGNNMPIGVGAPPVGFGYSCRAQEEVDITWPVPTQVTLGSATMQAASMRIAVKAPAYTPTYLSALTLSSDIASSVPAAPLELNSLHVDQFGYGISAGNPDTFIDTVVSPGGTVGLQFGNGGGPATLVAKEYDKSTPKLLESCVKGLVVDVDPVSLDQPGLELVTTIADSPDFDDTPNASSLILERRPDSFFDIFVDFTQIGSPTHNVVILDGDTLVANLHGLSGPVGSMSFGPRKIGKLGGPTECFTVTTDAGTFFTIGGQVYQGDQILILAEGGAAAQCKDLLSFTATNAPAGVTILDMDAALKLPPWIVKFGNAHSLVGSPIVACDDVLYVWRDLGDPGFSGVALEVPGVDGASATFELSPGAVDAVHRIVTKGINDVVPVEETLALSVLPNDVVSVSFDAQAPAAATIHALLDGQTVFSRAAVLPAVPTQIVTMNLAGIDSALATVHPVWAAKECKDQIALDTAVPMNFAAVGGGTVIADAVVIVRATNDPPALSSVALTGTPCTPNSVVSHESIDKLGWTFTGLGHAHLDATAPNAVTVPCCLGSSGEDGVEVELGCASSFDLKVDFHDWIELKSVVTLRGVAGDFGGQAGGWTTGSLSIVRSSFFDVFADFSEIGTDTKHVIVKNSAGIPVFQTVTSDAFIGQLSAAPFKLGKLGGTTPCYRACMPAGTLFTLGPVVVDAHEIQILAVGGTDAGCKSAARLTGTGDLGSFSITGVETQSACLGDLDGDGQVAGPDLAILLGAWSTGSVDLNADAQTDAADLAILLGAWGGC